MTMKLNEFKKVFENENCNIVLFTKEFNDEIATVFSWISQKNNSIVLHNDAKQESGKFQDSVLELGLRDLNIMLMLLKERAYQYNSSNFDLLFKKNKKISVLSVKFKKFVH